MLNSARLTFQVKGILDHSFLMFLRHTIQQVSYVTEWNKHCTIQLRFSCVTIEQITDLTWPFCYKTDVIALYTIGVVMLL